MNDQCFGGARFVCDVSVRCSCLQEVGWGVCSGVIVAVCGYVSLSVCVYALVRFRSYPFVTAGDIPGARQPPGLVATLSAHHAISIAVGPRQCCRRAWLRAKKFYRRPMWPRTCGDRRLEKEAVVLRGIEAYSAQLTDCQCFHLNKAT